MLLSLLASLLFLATPAALRGDPITPEQRKEAAAAFQKEDWSKASSIYAAITAAEPSNAAAWHRLGYCHYKLKDYDRALPAFVEAAETGKRSDSMFDVACISALQKKPDVAFEWLDKALAAGFADEKSFLADPDLESLRADPRFAAGKIKVRANARPCSVDPKAREFDFWIGEWDVKDTQSGVLVGHNSIQLILGDCVIFENWTNTQGRGGKSFNVYNKDKGFWQQTWIDDRGDVTEYEHGFLKEGALQFVAGPKKVPEGEQITRMTFFDQGPDQVRQFIETSTNGGKGWTPLYDLTYTRKKTPSGTK